MADNLIAFADESVRANASPPMYLIAATLLPADVDLAGLEAMLPKGATKLHWRDLGTKAQREALAKIAGLGSKSTVVIASPIVPSKQERARRKNLEALLPLLESVGVAKCAQSSWTSQTPRPSTGCGYPTKC